MSSSYQDSRKLRYNGDRIAMMCPVCYHVAHIGNVEMKATIQAPPTQDPYVRLDFDHTSILTYPQTGHEFESSQLIEVYCCEPQHGFNEPKMIALDGPIAQLIADLNKAGAYTVASCCGNHMYAGGSSLHTKAYILFLTPFTEVMKNELTELEAVNRAKLLASYKEGEYRPRRLENAPLFEVEDLFPEDSRYQRTGIYGCGIYDHFGEYDEGDPRDRDTLGPIATIREYFIKNPSPEVEAYCKANKAKYPTLMDVYKKGVELCGTNEIPEKAQLEPSEAEFFEGV